MLWNLYKNIYASPKSLSKYSKSFHSIVIKWMVLVDENINQWFRLFSSTLQNIQNSDAVIRLTYSQFSCLSKYLHSIHNMKR